MRDYDSPEERTLTVIEQIAAYLSCSFKTELPALPEKRSLIQEGVRSYFEKYAEEWTVFQEWVDSGEDYGVMGELFTEDRLLSIHKYCQNEMEYDWLLSDRKFAYDYTF